MRDNRIPLPTARPIRRLSSPGRDGHSAMAATTPLKMLSHIPSPAMPSAPNVVTTAQAMLPANVFPRTSPHRPLAARPTIPALASPTATPHMAATATGRGKSATTTTKDSRSHVAPDQCRCSRSRRSGPARRSNASPTAPTRRRVTSTAMATSRATPRKTSTGVRSSPFAYRTGTVTELRWSPFRASSPRRVTGISALHRPCSRRTALLNSSSLLGVRRQRPKPV